MNSITKWVEQTVFGVPESRIDNYWLDLYINFLMTESYDRFIDLIGEAHQSFDSFDYIKSLMEGNFQGQWIIDKSHVYRVFKTDLMTHIHELEEIEESEPDDHGMKNSDFWVL